MSAFRWPARPPSSRDTKVTDLRDTARSMQEAAATICELKIGTDRDLRTKAVDAVRGLNRGATALYSMAREMEDERA